MLKVNVSLRASSHPWFPAEEPIFSSATAALLLSKMLSWLKNTRNVSGRILRGHCTLLGCFLCWKTHGSSERAEAFTHSWASLNHGRQRRRISSVCFEKWVESSFPSQQFIPVCSEAILLQKPHSCAALPRLAGVSLMAEDPQGGAVSRRDTTGPSHRASWDSRYKKRRSKTLVSCFRDERCSPHFPASSHRRKRGSWNDSFLHFATKGVSWSCKFVPLAAGSEQGGWELSKSPCKTKDCIGT